MTQMNWNDLDMTERQDILHDLIHVQNLTAATAARILGTTRSAIAGAASRYGVKRAHPFVRISAPKVTEARKAAKPKPDYDVEEVTPFDPSYVPPKEAWAALPGSTPVLIEQHQNHTCRWPIGDTAPWLFCGLPVHKEGVYCEAHHLRGTKPREKK